MNEYMFSIIRKKPNATTAKRYERIARKHGGSFVESNRTINSCPSINNGHYYAWFAIDNYGSPHNENTAHDILAECGLLKDSH